MATGKQDWHGEERRFFIRIARRLNVSYRIAGAGSEPHQGRTENVSIGGVELVSRAELLLGAELEVSIGSDAEGVLVSLPGVVKRCSRSADEQDYRIGVEFVGSVQEHQDSLLRLAPPYILAMDGRQNRRFVRLGCKLPLWYKRTLFARLQRVTTVNLSPGGVMFGAASQVWQDDRLRVRLCLPARPTLKAGLKLSARVVNVQGEGASGSVVSAIFINPSEEAQEEIGAYIARGASPDRVEAAG